MPSAYGNLLDRLRRIGAIGEAAGVLHWDMETYMPPGGVEARALQLSTLSAISHDFFTAPAFGELLAAAEKEETDDKHRAQLRETRWAYDRATKVPTELVEAMSRATSQALPIWTQARKDSDFTAFRPILETIIELRRKYAAAIDADAPPYEVLFGDYEPWIPLDETRKNLNALRKGVQPLIDRAATIEHPPSPFGGKWDTDAQIAFNKEVLQLIGYDFKHGRLDISAHPFSTGNAYDARITTRYDAEDVLSGVGSTIHEFGHSLYTLGLPKEDFGTPLGDARDLVVHESQSRLWENHVGRSLPFWKLIFPRMGKMFPGKLEDATPESAWRAANRVAPSPIRVEADELTYHMHIALRFEVEEGIISGKTKVDEIPGVWNEKMESYLGITPKDDAHGCLQDIHWSHGSFGYFPTYSLGSILAAQLFETFAKTQDPAELIASGNFSPLRKWLRENIHQHGKRHKTSDLIHNATGAPLSPDAWLRYAHEKFERVWA